MKIRRNKIILAPVLIALSGALVACGSEDTAPAPQPAASTS